MGPRIRATATAVTLLAMGTGAAGASAATPTPAFAPVTGSPFATTGSPSGYGDGPRELAFSPDGALLATGNDDDSVSEFSVGGAGSLTQLPGTYVQPYSQASAIGWNPSGTLLAVAISAYKYGQVHVYRRGPGGALTDTGNGASTDDSLNALAFSPDGHYLAVAASNNYVDPLPGSVLIYRVADHGDLTEIPASPLPTADVAPRSVAFSPDGRFLAVSNSSGSVSVFAAGPNASFAPVAGSPFAVGGGGEIAYRPNGRLLAAAAGGSVRLVAVAADGALTASTSASVPGGAAALAWSPDGALLATAGGQTDSVLRVGPRRALTPVPGSPFAVGAGPASVAFSPDGRLLATADDGDSTVTVLSASPPSCAPAFTRTRGPVGVTLSCTAPTDEPLTRSIVSGPAHGTLTAIDQSTGQVVYTPDPGFAGVDRFTFTATTGSGVSEPATATVVVAAPRSPSG